LLLRPPVSEDAGAVPDRVRAAEPLERGRLAGKGASPREAEQCRFALACALWASGRDRARALALARQARAGLASLDDAKDIVAEVDAWLAERTE